MKIKKNAKKATTLIEVIIAISILALALLPIFGLLSYSNKGTRAQDAEGIAANLAKEEMNKLLNVIKKDTLLGYAGSEQDWSLGPNYKVKGNKFTGKFQVFKVPNNSIKFKVPILKLHDPRNCTNGNEANSGLFNNSNDATVDQILPNLTKPLMVDIILKVKWRLAYETKDDPNKSFILVARRAFLVKNSKTP